MKRGNSLGRGWLGIFLVLVAVFGAFQLYQVVMAPDMCDTAEDWARTTDARFNDASRRTQSLISPPTSPNEVRTVVASLRADAAAQRDSSPPDIAEELNGALVSFYVMLAAAFEAAAQGSQSPSSDMELDESLDRLSELREDFNSHC